MIGNGPTCEMKLVIVQGLIVTIGIEMAANEVLINDVNIAPLTKHQIANNATIKTNSTFAMHYIAFEA